MIHRVVFALTGFPERTDSVGIWWNPIEPLTAELSYDRTLTVVDQEFQNTAVYLDYNVTDLMFLGFGISYSVSDQIRSNRGRVLVDDSRAIYYQLTVGITY